MGTVVLSSAVSVGTVVAMWLLASGRREGWYVSLMNQPGWVALSILTGAWGLLPLNLVMTAIAVRGACKWKGKR